MTHKRISFIKSTIRIAGYFIGVVAFSNNPLPALAFFVLIISEMAGVAEEIGEK